jgi:hypothetical protein
MPRRSRQRWRATRPLSPIRGNGTEVIGSGSPSLWRLIGVGWEDSQSRDRLFVLLFGQSATTRRQLRSMDSRSVFERSFPEKLSWVGCLFSVVSETDSIRLWWRGCSRFRNRTEAPNVSTGSFDPARTRASVLIRAVEGTGRADPRAGRGVGPTSSPTKRSKSSTRRLPRSTRSCSRSLMAKCPGSRPTPLWPR